MHLDFNQINYCNANTIIISTITQILFIIIDSVVVVIVVTATSDFDVKLPITS